LQRPARLLRDTVEVCGAAADIFAFFDGMDQARYLGWHPDHRVFCWTRGQGLGVGNRFYFEEVIAGKLLNKHVEFTRIERGTHVEFAPTSRLMRFFLPRLVFRVERLGPRHSRLIAEIVLRIGPLAARLNKRELVAVRDHMRVEGMNLKRYVETGGDSHERDGRAS
jgi:hypothetical protein